jgi:hypothetical protein
MNEALQILATVGAVEQPDEPAVDDIVEEVADNE